MAFGAFVVLALCIGWALSIAIHALGSGWSRRTTNALVAGAPRRSRALARIHGRRCAAEQRRWPALLEAKALLWEGEFERAIALLDTRVLSASGPALGVLPMVLKLECLVFDERLDEAKALFTLHADTLRSTKSEGLDVAAISAFLRFYEGDLESAREELYTVVEHAPPREPIVRAIHLYLAAIAHRQGRRDDTRRHLVETMVDGGDLFVVRLAAAHWEEALPDETMPERAVPARRRMRASRLPNLVRDVGIGLNVLVFRTAPLHARTFTVDQLASLALFNLGLVFALRLIDYSRGASFHASGALAVTAPVLFFLLTAHVATRQAEGKLRLLCGFYGALPSLLVLAFVAARVRERHDTAGVALELIAAAWSLAIVVRLARSVARDASVVRILACAVVFIATWLVPMHNVGSTPVFFVPMTSVEDYEVEERRHDELVFAQADQVHAAEASLAPERPGVTDLYFVGAACWADQDVFLSEVESARRLLDDRFDTRGRSLIFANDPSSRDVLPLATTMSLRHALKAVGARMNREEDILFLFVTSHGDDDGLGLRFPRGEGFGKEVLSPADLRSMLDDAGIKWRVLVISGCHSGVFLTALQNPFTLLATASAHDRESYGCETGNGFTDFGRAVFGEQLVHERSFITALVKATQEIERREVERNLRTSRPQMFHGSAVGPKLRELEERLGAGR